MNLTKILPLLSICLIPTVIESRSATRDVLYQEAAKIVAADSPIFGEPDSFTTIEGPENIDDFGKYYRCNGKLYTRISAEDNTLRSVLNGVLTDAIRDGKYEQKIPLLRPNQAVEKARDYLKKFNFDLPETCILRKVKFSNSQWHVEWEPTWGGYRQLDFDFLNRLRLVTVSFHEKMGVCLVQRELVLPAPASLEVMLSQEVAISKAERLTDEVMRTPFYRMARMSGFIVNGVQSCELRIVKPNWLLDPRRAIWGLLRSDEIVKETRLCWVVTFTTIDTKEEERGKDDNGNPLKLKRPNILIFIDAANGDCVGANFT